MSNILLVDTNFSSGPIYHFLIQSGHNVTVVGGNPHDGLAKSVDNYVQLDYSDIEKTRKLVVDRNIEFLVPGCNDRSYMVCAEINQDGRFPGVDSLHTAEIINNKEKFREFAALHNLPSPRVLTKKEIGTRWPVVVKPVDAFSGRGVAVIRKENSHDLPAALDAACQVSRTKNCIIEDYVEGQLYSHTAFIQNGEIFANYIVEEHCIVNPYVVDTSRVVDDFPENLLKSIQKDIAFLAAKLKLQDGLVHSQFICNGSQYWLIEITRRCPGDLYSQLIELSTGFEYAENYARPFLGLPFKMQDKYLNKWVMRHTLTQSFEYKFGSLEFCIPLMIIKWISISQAGDRVRESPFGRIGVIFTESLNAVQFDAVWRHTLSRNLYELNNY
jgi:carbamoylphosphate synthase large subunit